MSFRHKKKKPCPVCRRLVDVVIYDPKFEVDLYWHRIDGECCYQKPGEKGTTIYIRPME